MYNGHERGVRSYAAAVKRAAVVAIVKPLIGEDVVESSGDLTCRYVLIDMYSYGGWIGPFTLQFVS